MTSYLNTTLIKNAYTYLCDTVGVQKIDSIHLLEPLSVIIKLAIISFKKDRTKIAINNNKMFIQKPSAWQGVIRYVYGNNREEISHLLKPIKRSIELYPPKNNTELHYIYSRAIMGLKKVKTGYDELPSTVCHSIDLYISILEEGLSGNKLKVDTYDRSKNIDDLNLSVQTRINLEKIFTDIWSKDDITLLYSMFKSVDNQSASTQTYLKSIENLLKSKEPIINQKVKKTRDFII
tara:strand:- start:6543 stop:7247 length:705 start_codon:yes stop_codon:yes gene_type:complete